MKNKKLLGLTALCCTSMLLFACNNNNKKPTPHGPTLYTVTFISEGEIFDIRQAEAGDVVTPPASDPIKLDHEFIGWYTSESDFGEKWIFETDVVEEDMSLYARFQENQIDYTVRFLLDGEVAETRTTNSRDQNDITVPQIAVGEGKSLLGFGIAAGSGAGAVDYRVGATFSYNQAVILADDNNVVDLHAIVKTGEIARLNVGLWTRYADEACMNRVLTAFKSYADDHSVTYDFLDYTAFAPAASSGDAYFAVKDYAAGLLQDTSIGVAFPSGSNLSDQTGMSAVIKQHVGIGVTIKNAIGTSDSTGRYVTRLSDNTLDVAFVTWLLSDDGKVVLDPEYEPSTEHGEASATKLVFGVWGRFFSEELATGLVNATKTYLTAQGITYDDVEAVYYNSTDYNGKAAYLGAAKDDLSLDILLPVSKAIAKGTDSDIPATFQPKFGTTLNLGETDGDDEGLGLTIGGQTNRWLVALNNDAITNAFITFCSTEDGMKALDPTHGETPISQTTVTMSFYGKNISETNANKIIAEIERYFTANSIAYTDVVKDYVTGDLDNAGYAAAISKSSDLSIGGGKASSLNTAFTNNGFTVARKENLGTIAGATERYIHTFNNGELTEAVYTYLLSTDGQAFLATLTA